MERRIRSELLKMTTIMLVMVGVGIYAHDFVIAGIQAKVALNSSIFALFSIAAALAFRNVLGLRNEVLALKALKTDYGDRKHTDATIYDRPAIIFHEPQLLGQGYRLITEQLAKEDNVQLPSKVVESLVHSVDQRINERKSVLTYFAGLMVFMGLLGAFMGLMHTVGSVSDLIGGMDVSGGGGAGDDAFGKMIDGMKAPLKGMSVGFSSSLFGLSTSMVLGALERCMTTAAKVLRDEYEHWLSKLATLEGAGEATGHAAQPGNAIVESIAHQLQNLNAAAEQGQRQDRQTHETLIRLQEAMTALATATTRMADPSPVLAPIATAMTDMVRHHTGMVAQMEEMFARAREDRADVRAALNALHGMATAQETQRAEERAMLLAQLDRVATSNEAVLDRDPVVIQWPGGDTRPVTGGARQLQERLTAAFTGWRRRAGEQRDTRTMAHEVAASLASLERLRQEIRGEMAQLRSTTSADASRTAAVLRDLDAERERLALLAGVLDPAAGEGDLGAVLDRAQVQMELLAARARAARSGMADDGADRQLGGMKR